MTLLSLLIGGIVAAIWLRTFGPVLYGGVTVYIALMLLTFGTAAFYAWRRGEAPERWTIAVVLFVMVGRHAGWQSQSPYVIHAFAGLAGGIALALTMNARYQAIIAAAFGVQAIFAYFAYSKGFSPAGIRGNVLIGLTYPDVLAMVGHGVNVALGTNFDGTMPRLRMVCRRVFGRVPSRASGEAVARSRSEDRG